jgi:pimeloyl-ACP methyl ester carboxylesterase
MTVWANSGRIAAQGASLEYQCHGPSPDQAATLVLLHEGLGCIALWRDFPAQLAAATGLGVLVFSRAGYGRSDPATLPRPLDYMTQEAVNVLPDVLDGLGIRRALLVGHSDGATIAAIYAGSVSDPRVRGLVLMAPHFFTEPMGLAEIARTGAAFDAGDMATRMAKYHSDPVATFRGWNDAWLHPGFAAWDVSDVIDHWRIPVLAIQGRDDPFVTLPHITEMEERAYSPVEVLILDDCGHTPFSEHPAAVLSSISDFTARLMRMEAAQSASA